MRAEICWYACHIVDVRSWSFLCATCRLSVAARAKGGDRAAGSTAAVQCDMSTVVAKRPRRVPGRRLPGVMRDSSSPRLRGAGRLRPFVSAAGEPERAHARCSAKCCGVLLCYVPFRSPAAGSRAAVPDGFREVRGECCCSSSFTDAKPFASPGRLREKEGGGSDLRGVTVIPDSRPSRRRQPPGRMFRPLWTVRSCVARDSK